MTVEDALKEGLRLHEARDYAQAEAMYRQVLAQRPDQPDALHLLGVLNYEMGRAAAAIDLIRQALSFRPDFLEAIINLGAALQANGQVDEAIAAYERALRINPKIAGIYNNLGNALLATGRVDQAIDAYHKAIELDGNIAEAHGNLGRALKMTGQTDAAIAALSRAVALRPGSAEGYNALGVALKDSGRFSEAIDALEKAVAIAPGVPEIYNNLGIGLGASGRRKEAIAAFERAIALRPDNAETLSNFGNVLKDGGRFDEAVEMHQRAIGLKADYAEGHNNLGGAMRARGQLVEAIAAYRRAIALKSDYAEAYSNLGNALIEQREPEEAVTACRRAIELRVDGAEAYNSLGIALAQLGEQDKAVDAFRRAIAIRPDYVEALSNLGNSLADIRRLDEAVAAHRQAIGFRADYAEAHNNLGNALRAQGKLDDAMTAYRQAIAIRPGFSTAYGNLGIVLSDLGRIDEAIEAYRQAVALKPDDPTAHSDLIFAMNFHPGSDARMIARELGEWNRRHGEPLRKMIQPQANNREAERRLRIGYVSPDFREHVVGQNLLPLFHEHDHGGFEIVCYSQVGREDEMTARLKKHADLWRPIAGLSDERAARQIREDRIDILVDLAMHMGGNRLAVFAGKPAPVQVSCFAYPGSAGLETIEYRLTDPYLEPAGLFDDVYSDRAIRLADSFWCYDPPAGDGPAVTPLPAEVNGFVTFGCLNNFCKVNDLALEMWTAVLNSVAGSKMLVMAPEGSARTELVRRLADLGVESGRVEFVGRQSRRGYLEVYHRIDIGLDTIPYNGHTTSLDALWMGVPVVTLVGSTVVGRAGWSQLNNLGLVELAGKTPGDYVMIAAALAADMPKLSVLRKGLRQRMEKSPLMDAARFARNIESAYRQMWRKWCESAAR